MVDKYDYLLKRGWSLEDAKRYVEMQEQGKTPTEAYADVKGQNNPVTHEFEPKQSASEEYALESDSDYARQKYAEAKAEASELYEKGKDITLRAAGLKERNLKEAAISTAGKVLKSFKPKPLTKEQKEIQQAYNEAKYRAQVESAKAQGRASGYGGYSVARQPKRVKTVIVMRPPSHQDLPEDDMGMSFGTFGDPIGHIPGVSEPVQYRMRERPLVRNVEARLPKTNIPKGGREPVQYNPVNNPGANSLVSLGNARNPVNIDVKRTSTKIPKTEKPRTKFKGRRPKTETKKPKISVNVVPQKMFWEW